DWNRDPQTSNPLLSRFVSVTDRVVFHLRPLGKLGRFVTSRAALASVFTTCRLTTALAGACLLLGPSLVRASCGDYVQLTDEKAVGMRHTVEQVVTPATRSAPAGPHVPCTGLNCSQRPERDPIAPVPAPRSTIEQWAAPLGWPGLQAPDGAEPA